MELADLQAAAGMGVTTPKKIPSRGQSYAFALCETRARRDKSFCAAGGRER
jgi:hypothetical protein